MCLVFLYFILIVSLAERKKFCFGKENGYEMEGHHEFFLLKIPFWGPPLRTPKMEGTTIKNSKMKGMSANFCYRNKKNRSTPLFKGQ